MLVVQMVGRVTPGRGSGRGQTGDGNIFSSVDEGQTTHLSFARGNVSYRWHRMLRGAWTLPCWLQDGPKNDDYPEKCNQHRNTGSDPSAQASKELP